MRIKTLTGKLTRTEKSHIKALLATGTTWNKSGRKHYFTLCKNGVYTVRITENKKGFKVTFTSTFREV